MGINDDAFAEVEGIAEDDIGGLAAHAIELDQRIHGVGNLALMSFDQGAATALDAPRLIPEEPELMDRVLEVGNRCGSVIGCGWMLLKQRGSDPIHQFVRALGGEDGGNEEFEWIRKVEFAVGVGISALQCLEQKIEALTFS